MNKALILRANSNYGLTEMTYNDGESYEFLRNAVGGYLQLVPNTYFDEKGIDLWCNEEGKLNDLPCCAALVSENKVFDIVVGNIVFTRANDMGETVSLTDEDIDYIKDWYNSTTWHVDLARGLMIPIITY